ncbi:MAG: DUF2752 domain-containing protein [Christensenellales bacterium]
MQFRPIDKKKNIKTFKRIGATIIALILFIIYSVLTTEFLGSACPFYLLFGIPCPGCGMTRAYLALFHGDIALAFSMHPLFWVVPFALILGAYSVVVYKKSSKKTRVIEAIMIILCIVFVITYVVRMISFYPYEYPLVYNENCLFKKIIDNMKR